MFSGMKPHLIELRKRLAISVLAIFIGFIVAFTFHNTILGWITQPLNDALIQVGKIVESRQNGSWTVRHSTTKAGRSKKKTSSTPAGSSPLRGNIRSAERLEKTLRQAASVTTDSHLAALLIRASEAARDLAQGIRDLDTKLAAAGRGAKTEKEKLKEKSFNGMITTHQVGGAFFVALKVSFFAGILMAMPVILWQLWLFIAPGLYEHEKKMVLPFVLGGSVMFLTGVLFAYYIVTPFGFQFLITFGSFLYTPLINIEDYVGFFTKIMAGFGIAFELPVVTYFLALLGLITDRTLKDFFKYAVVIIFLLAALLTPPDILTQLLMAAPLIILYGLSILIVRFVNPESPEDEDETDEETGSGT
jgi:sec-independent protein translocase protein TatC